MPKSPISDTDFIRTATAARILGVSSETARGWANAGRLRVTMTLDGMRLFSRSDCERVCRHRARHADDVTGGGEGSDGRKEEDLDQRSR